MGNSAKEPLIIFYLGPAGQSKTRQALRTIAPNPRSLVVTLEQDPYEFRTCHWHDFDSNCRELPIPLHGAKHVRIAGHANWRREILSERVYDRLFFKDLPEPFRQSKSALELAQSLARLAMLRSADVVVSLDFAEADAIVRWEKSLHFNWQGRDHTIGFWVNVAGDSIRYLRIPATQLLALPEKGDTRKVPSDDLSFFAMR